MREMLSSPNPSKITSSKTLLDTSTGRPAYSPATVMFGNTKSYSVSNAIYSISGPSSSNFFASLGRLKVM